MKLIIQHWFSFFFCPRSKFKDSVEQECRNPGLEGCIQPGFLTNQVDISFPLALTKAVFCQGGQKIQLDCGHRGLGSNTTGVEIST